MSLAFSSEDMKRARNDEAPRPISPKLYKPAPEPKPRASRVPPYLPPQSPLLSPEDREAQVELAERIRAYWRARGYEPEVTIINMGFSVHTRGSLWVVRSNLINGQPR